MPPCGRQAQIREPDGFAGGEINWIPHRVRDDARRKAEENGGCEEKKEKRGETKAAAEENEATGEGQERSRSCGG